MQALALVRREEAGNIDIVHVVAEGDVGVRIAAVAAIRGARQNSCNRGNIGSGSTGGRETIGSSRGTNIRGGADTFARGAIAAGAASGVADGSTVNAILLLQIDVVARLGDRGNVDIDIDTS